MAVRSKLRRGRLTGFVVDVRDDDRYPVGSESLRRCSADPACPARNERHPVPVRLHESLLPAGMLGHPAAGLGDNGWKPALRTRKL